MSQFHFLIAADAAKQLADDIEAYPHGPQPLAARPVHARIVAELRKPPHDREDEGDGFAGPHVLCSVELGDEAVLSLWAVDPDHEGRPWRDALRRGLDDGARM